MNLSRKERFANYLEAYSDKNLQRVSDMFSADIALQDWKISVFGKDAAIAETEKKLPVSQNNRDYHFGLLRIRQYSCR